MPILRHGMASKCPLMAHVFNPWASLSGPQELLKGQILSNLSVSWPFLYFFEPNDVFHLGTPQRTNARSMTWKCRQMSHSTRYVVRVIKMFESVDYKLQFCLSIVFGLLELSNVFYQDLLRELGMPLDGSKVLRRIEAPLFPPCTLRWLTRSTIIFIQWASIMYNDASMLMASKRLVLEFRNCGR